MSSDCFEFAEIKASGQNGNMGFRFVDQANSLRWLNQILLITIFSLILFVTLVDIWFAVINDEILAQEANPICKWLIRLASNSLEYFIAGKILGALSVVSILYVFSQAKYQYARLVMVAVTLS